MNTTVIYFSPTETTKKVVTQIATGFGNKNQEYDLTLPSNRDNLKTINFKEEDCVIIGLPVYSGRIPLFMETYLLHMRGNNTPAILTVVYGNRDYDDALLELSDVLKNQGFNIIGACAFIGEHSYTKKVAENRPDQKDLELAHNFGKIINSKLNNINNSDFPQLSIKGNHPYKKRKQSPVYAPITNQNCTDCGICAKNCPMGAIDISDYKTVDAQLCIHCCSCIKKCPVNAKKFDNPIFNKIINFLIENCTTKRKEPEIFF